MTVTDPFLPAALDRIEVPTATVTFGATVTFVVPTREEVIQWSSYLAACGVEHHVVEYPREGDPDPIHACEYQLDGVRVSVLSRRPSAHAAALEAEAKAS